MGGVDAVQSSLHLVEGESGQRAEGPASVDQLLSMQREGRQSVTYLG